jgi:hypothetical protein
MVKLLVALLILIARPASGASLEVSVPQIFEKQKSILQAERQGSFWHYPMYMGLQITSQLWLVSNWLERVDPKWDLNRFKELLLSTQMPDGSWQYVGDINNPSGDIDATVLNYWALNSASMNFIYWIADLNRAPLEVT